MEKGHLKERIYLLQIDDSTHDTKKCESFLVLQGLLLNALKILLDTIFHYFLHTSKRE